MGWLLRTLQIIMLVLCFLTVVGVAKCTYETIAFMRLATPSEEK